MSGQHKTELVSAAIRWFFLISCSVLVYCPPFPSLLGYNQTHFFFLVIFAFLSFSFCQYVLVKYTVQDLIYRLTTKSSVFGDAICSFWLLLLTGGYHSPFFPILYVVLIHTSIYWKHKGALLMAAMMSLSYLLMIIFSVPSIVTDSSFIYQSGLQICFLFIIGFYSGFIGSQERKHYDSSNYYKEMAARDYLTGLYNHMQFQETLNKLEQTDKKLYLMMADIDHFKQINDTYGHTAGDLILREVGQLFTSIVDDEQGMVFRYGGEEFSIILHTGSEKEANALTQQLLESLRNKSFLINGERIKVTISLGIASNENRRKKDVLIEHADRSLYLAKMQGRDRAVFAT